MGDSYVDCTSAEPLPYSGFEATTTSLNADFESFENFMDDDNGYGCNNFQVQRHNSSATDVSMAAYGEEQEWNSWENQQNNYYQKPAYQDQYYANQHPSSMDYRQTSIPPMPQYDQGYYGNNGDFRYHGPGANFVSGNGSYEQAEFDFGVEQEQQLTHGYAPRDPLTRSASSSTASNTSMNDRRVNRDLSIASDETTMTTPSVNKQAARAHWQSHSGYDATMEPTNYYPKERIVPYPDPHHTEPAHAVRRDAWNWKPSASYEVSGPERTSKASSMDAYGPSDYAPSSNNPSYPGLELPVYPDEAGAAPFSEYTSELPRGSQQRYPPTAMQNRKHPGFVSATQPLSNLHPKVVASALQTKSRQPNPAAQAHDSDPSKSTLTHKKTFQPLRPASSDNNSVEPGPDKLAQAPSLKENNLPLQPSGIKDVGLKSSNPATNTKIQSSATVKPERLTKRKSTGETILSPLGKRGGGQRTKNTDIKEPLSKKAKEHKGVSMYRGVSWHKRDRRWLARLWVDGKIRYLGSYFDEHEAALAVDLCALKEFGNSSARLNFTPEQREKLMSSASKLPQL